MADQCPMFEGPWSLPHPLAEGMPAHEHVCFYPDKVELAVNGVLLTQ